MTRSTNPPSPHSSSTGHRTPVAAGLADKASKVDLSATQIAGGALAAMTAAALGSRLGVGGTITGAAFASIIAGVAGSLYTATLRHTRQTVATALTGRAGNQPSESAPAEVAPGATETVGLSAARDRGPRLRWKTVVAAAVASFAVALVALTGFESLAGAALSGGQGTTIQQVAKSESTQQDDDGVRGSDESPSASPEPTDDETSPVPAEEPSATAPEDPSPSSAEPTSPAEAEETQSEGGERQRGESDAPSPGGS